MRKTPRFWSPQMNLSAPRKLLSFGLEKLSSQRKKSLGCFTQPRLRNHSLISAQNGICFSENRTSLQRDILCTLRSLHGANSICPARSVQNFARKQKSEEYHTGLCASRKVFSHGHSTKYSTPKKIIKRGEVVQQKVEEKANALSSQLSKLPLAVKSSIVAVDLEDSKRLKWACFHFQGPEHFSAPFFEKGH